MDNLRLRNRIGSEPLVRPKSKIRNEEEGAPSSRSRGFQLISLPVAK
jgi:hypothetical protein